jgi:hypothetical protein
VVKKLSLTGLYRKFALGLLVSDQSAHPNLRTRIQTAASTSLRRLPIHEESRSPICRIPRYRRERTDFVERPDNGYSCDRRTDDDDTRPDTEPDEYYDTKPADNDVAQSDDYRHPQPEHNHHSKPEPGYNTRCGRHSGDGEPSGRAARCA